MWKILLQIETYKGYENKEEPNLIPRKLPMSICVPFSMSISSNMYSSTFKIDKPGTDLYIPFIIQQSNPNLKEGRMMFRILYWNDIENFNPISRDNRRIGFHCKTRNSEDSYIEFGGEIS